MLMESIFKNTLFLSFLAGFVGAFGNQLLYWRRILRVRDRQINPKMIFISIFYVLTGGGVGFFIGKDYPNSYMFMLGGGAAWPTLLKSMDDVRQFAKAVQNKLGSTNPSEGNQL